MPRFSKTFELIEDWVSGIFLVTGLGLMFYGVIMRYVSSPVFWIDEIATYLVIWGALLGLGVALREGRHIQVVALYDKFSPNVRWGISIFNSILSIVFCIFFTYGGFLLDRKYLMLGQESLNAQIPLWIPSLIIPISGVLFGLRFIGRLVGMLKDGGRSWKAEEERRKNDVDYFTL